LEQCLQIYGTVAPPDVSVVLGPAADGLAVSGEPCLQAPIWISKCLPSQTRDSSRRKAEGNEIEVARFACQPTAHNSEVDSRLGQSGQSSLGGNLARKRYQKGYLFLRGMKQQVWVGRWLEDVIGADNKVFRIHKSEVIGTKADFPTKRLAQRELDIRLSRINSLSYQPQKVISFADFAERWKQNVMSNYKPSTRSGMKSSVNRWLVPRFGELQLHQITPEMLQQFLSNAPVKPKTVRNLFITFKLMWATARAWGYAEKNICEGIVLPARGVVEEPWFTEDEMRQIINEADEPYRTMFWVDAETGIRGGELCALKIEDFNFDHRIVNVRRSVWKGELQTTKSKKGVRTFAISQQLCEHLKTYLLGQWKDNPEKLLFCTREGTPYDNRDIVDQVLHPILGRLGIKRAGLHAFRHGNETIMDRLNTPMRVRQDRLGHEKAETTMGYTHVIGDDDRKVAAELGRILCPTLPKPSEVEAANPQPLQ
jgi:integrase